MKRIFNFVHRGAGSANAGMRRRFSAVSSTKRVAAACLFVFSVVVVGYATDIPWWIGHLCLGIDPIEGGDENSPLVKDWEGFKFELLYNAKKAKDPLNLANEVVKIDTTAGQIGVIQRKLYPGVNIAELTDQLQLKYYFPPQIPQRTCSAGSPRIQLAIDLNGDGHSDANAMGYVGHAGFGGGCVTGAWDFIDMTDSVMFRWDFSQFPPPVGPNVSYNWSQAVAALNLSFPNHKVLRASLVDDSGSFDVAAAGVAYYDLVTMGHRTLENWSDIICWSDYY